MPAGFGRIREPCQSPALVCEPKMIRRVKQDLCRTR
jgi:hypothetical protein